MIFKFKILFIFSWDLYAIFLLIALEFVLRSKCFFNYNEFLRIIRESSRNFPSWGIHNSALFRIFWNSYLIILLESLHSFPCSLDCIPQNLYLILHTRSLPMVNNFLIGSHISVVFLSVMVDFDDVIICN